MKRVELSDSERERFTISEGDLLFARRSLVAEGAGKCSVVLEVDDPTTFESSIIRARPDRSKATPLFLYYFFNSPAGYHALDTIRRHVAVAGITGSDLSRLEIPIPSLPEQHAIAHILGTLDDKIELSRRMNETLEAIARAIFKSWFVDFDPVRAKASGEPPESMCRRLGLTPDILPHFPDSFQKTERGDIPEGWKNSTFGDIAKNPRRGIQPDKLVANIPYIALEHMPRHCIALTEWVVADGLESNKFEFRKGEILFGKLRPYFHKVGIAPVNGVCSTDIVVVTPKAERWFGLVLGLISSDAFVAYTSAGSTGTKMPRTSWNDMAKYPIVLPSDGASDAFYRLVRPLADRIIASIHESRTLTTLRDTLLPKLLSGELRVPDAERIAKEVSA
jgi:type I restriction enzyme S subunit